VPGRTGKRRTWGNRPEREKPKKGGKNRRQTEREAAGRNYRSSDHGSASYETSGILKKYLEPDRDREREIEKKKREIMAAKQAREERRRKEMKEQAASRVSYVRKPFARRSRISFILAAEALIFGGAGLYRGVTTQGQAELVCGALGFCSVFLSLIAVWYGGISFLEENKNYILAKLGIATGVLLLAAWTYIIIMGLGG